MVSRTSNSTPPPGQRLIDIVSDDEGQSSPGLQNTTHNDGGPVQSPAIKQEHGDDMASNSGLVQPSTRASSVTTAQMDPVRLDLLNIQRGMAARHATSVANEAATEAALRASIAAQQAQLIALRAEGPANDIDAAAGPSTTQTNSSRRLGSRSRTKNSQNEDEDEDEAEEDLLDDEETQKRTEYEDTYNPLLVKKAAGQLDAQGQRDLNKMEMKENKRRSRWREDKLRQREIEMQSDGSEYRDEHGDENEDEHQRRATIYNNRTDFRDVVEQTMALRGSQNQESDEDEDATNNHDNSTSLGKRKNSQRAGKGSKIRKNAEALQLRTDGQFESIFRSNTLIDLQGIFLEPDQPVFGEDDVDKSVKAAIKDLIAKLPAEQRAAARIDETNLYRAIQCFCGAGASVKLAKHKAGFTVRGMNPNTVLDYYQIIGGGFMRSLELGDHQPHGGLLCDEMGLGKTIQILLNIVDDRPLNVRRKDPHLTLIVASHALILQWKSEIEKHCDKKIIGEVMIFDKDVRKMTPKKKLNAFKGKSIILTTYEEVARSFPAEDPNAEFDTEEEEITNRVEELENEAGLLHRLIFRRIVFDECQRFKNHRTNIAKACFALQGERRWLLSGTPISNGLEEFYSYLMVLHVPKLGPFVTWRQEHIGRRKTSAAPKTDEQIQKEADNIAECNKRLKQALSKIMLRRVYTDRMFGAPIMALPENQSNTLTVDFNEFESNVYKIVRNRIHTLIKTMKDDNTMSGKARYAHIFNLLGLLRQMTSHVLLVENALKTILTVEDIKELEMLTDQEFAIDTEARQGQIVQLRTMLNNEQHLRRHKMRESANGTGPTSSSTVRRADLASLPDINSMDVGYAGDEFGHSFDFRSYLKDFVEERWEDVYAEATCAVCKAKPEKPHVSSCVHVFCLECLDIIQIHAAEREEDRAKCPECAVTIMEVNPLKPRNFDNVKSLMEPVAEGDFGGGWKKRRSEYQVANNWIDRAGLDILPSSKLVACKAQILNWMEENPKAKIIIFAEFINVIKLLGRMCQVEGWSYVTYHGRKSHEKREEARKLFFDEDEGIQIMIASLKTGGVGLNLTVASRVIIVDLWWNSAVQALGRVLRHGQDKEVRMTSFAVADTVDSKLLQMQEYKDMCIEEVMEDKKLTTDQLLSVFDINEEAG